jgi:hypothetical protein
VTSIGDRAFDGCTNLTSVTVAGSVTSIGDGAFFYCVASVSLRSAKKPHPGGISWVSCGRARETDEERKLPSQPQPAAAMAC